MPQSVEICYCHCHLKHSVVFCPKYPSTCCKTCKNCGKRIKRRYYPSHVMDCWPKKVNVSNSSRRLGKNLVASQAVDLAAGRNIVVGESHDDRNGLNKMLKLMSQAHKVGYRTLGVEVSHEGFDRYRGLDQELQYIKTRVNRKLSEYDYRSYEEGIRMNRHWMIQKALKLGWQVIAIDPYHWDWKLETAYGFLLRRDPAMARVIGKHSLMVANCGLVHLAGIHRELGKSAFFLNVTPTEDVVDQEWSEFAERVRFASTVPLLV